MYIYVCVYRSYVQHIVCSLRGRAIRKPSQLSRYFALAPAQTALFLLLLLCCV